MFTGERPKNVLQIIDPYRYSHYFCNLLLYEECVCQLLTKNITAITFVKRLLYSKTCLQRISRDTSKNFVIAVIRYIDIAKFVILHNEFVLHKDSKPGMMNRCWLNSLYTYNYMKDPLVTIWKLVEGNWALIFFIYIETSTFGFANERFLKLYLKCLVEFGIYLRCLSLANPLFVHFELSILCLQSYSHLLGEAMFVNNTLKYKLFVKTIWLIYFISISIQTHR